MRYDKNYRLALLAVFVPFLSALEAQDYSMRIDAPASVSRGGTMSVTLRGTSNATPAKGLIGFSALISYDPARVSIASTDFAGTVFSDSEFQSVVDDGSGSLQIGVVHDQDGVSPPAQLVVPPGVDMAFLFISVSAGACTGSTSLGFTGTIDDNLLVDEDVAGHDTGNGLVLVPDTVNILGTGTFVRGNSKNDLVDIANPSFSVDIGDGIFLLQFLFQSGSSPSCDDAADVNDDGRINIVDAIAVFQFLIGNMGPTLPDPFSDLGPDPTPDGLGCANAPDTTGC